MASAQWWLCCPSSPVVESPCWPRMSRIRAGTCPQCRDSDGQCAIRRGPYLKSASSIRIFESERKRWRHLSAVGTQRHCCAHETQRHPDAASAGGLDGSRQPGRQIHHNDPSAEIAQALLAAVQQVATTGPRIPLPTGGESVYRVSPGPSVRRAVEIEVTDERLDAVRGSDLAGSAHLRHWPRRRVRRLTIGKGKRRTWI